MRFPPSFLERLKSHLVLSEVIGKRVPLKKHGREYHALCPFHNEKSPSFTVNDEKNFFHCFGCGAHGDAIGFIMKLERMTYPEAVESLARAAGIELPKSTPEEQEKYEQEKTLLGALEEATLWFERQLANASGGSARDYISRRGLTPETVKKFRIGYAPDSSRDALFQHLRKVGYPQSLQVDAGLIIVPEEGGVYDRFRGRVIFPIRNASGKVIAFGGRLMASDKNLPKYLNSPETTLFKKGQMLFNLDLAKRPAREKNQVAVMEGYMDVVATAQAGVDVAVATLGTAVTPEHIHLLWQLAKEPILCLDGDEAGRRAMKRAAEIALPLLKPGFSLRFAMLPQGEDPDSYIQKHGRASFEKILLHSRLLSQALWEDLKNQFRLDVPEGLAALEDATKKLAMKIADPTVRIHYQHAFKNHLYACRMNGAKAESAPRSAQVVQTASGERPAQFDALARQMLQIVRLFPALLHRASVEETLSQLEIRDRNLSDQRERVLHLLHDTGDDTAEFIIDIPEENIPGLRALSSIEQASAMLEKLVSACGIARIQAEIAILEESLSREWSEALQARKSELQEAIRAAQAGFLASESDAA